LWQKICGTLPDREDAEHVFTAAQNRAHFFLTLDNRTILKYRTHLERICGIIALRPSDFALEYKAWNAL
jgi:hypothetical protein